MNKKINNIFLKIINFSKRNTYFIIIFLVGLIFFYSTKSASFDDWDSAQFSMAIRDYDITKHQPHPPGFPVYIFLAKIFYYLFFHNELNALLAISIISGALSLALIYQIGKEMFSEKVGIYSSVILLAAPTFWLTSIMAFSDVPALAFLLAFLLFAHRAIKKPANFIPAMFLASLGVGVRPQNVWYFVFVFLYLVWFLYFKKKERRIFWLGLLSGFIIFNTWFWLMVFDSGGWNKFHSAWSAQWTVRYNQPWSAFQFNLGIRDLINFLFSRLAKYIKILYFDFFGIDFAGYLHALIKNQIQLFYDNYKADLMVVRFLIGSIFLVYAFTKIKLKSINHQLILLILIPALIWPFLVYTLVTVRYLVVPIAFLSLMIAYAFSEIKTNFWSKLINSTTIIIFFIIVISQTIYFARIIHSTPSAPAQAAKYIRDHYKSDQVIIISYAPYRILQVELPGYAIYLSNKQEYIPSELAKRPVVLFVGPIYNDFKKGREDFFQLAEKNKKDYKLIASFSRDSRIALQALENYVEIFEWK